MSNLLKIYVLTSTFSFEKFKLFFKNFCSSFRVRFRKPAGFLKKVSWLPITSYFHERLAFAHYFYKGSCLRCCKGSISSAVYSFLLKNFCFAFLVLLTVCYDCNKLMLLNVCFLYENDFFHFTLVKYKINIKEKCSEKLSRRTTSIRS